MVTIGTGLWYWDSCRNFKASYSFQVVEIIFTDFYTEEDWDVVGLFDGNDLSAPVIAYLSGHLTAPIVYSSSQQFMLVWFTSDGSGNHQGFNATFSSVARKLSIHL
jgi:hypothetical protein